MCKVVDREPGVKNQVCTYEQVLGTGPSGELVYAGQGVQKSSCEEQCMFSRTSVKNRVLVRTDVRNRCEEQDVYKNRCVDYTYCRTGVKVKVCIRTSCEEQ